jgi:hypothetical protein
MNMQWTSVDILIVVTFVVICLFLFVFKPWKASIGNALIGPPNGSQIGIAWWSSRLMTAVIGLGARPHFGDVDAGSLIMFFIIFYVPFAAFGQRNLRRENVSYLGFRTDYPHPRLRIIFLLLSILAIPDAFIQIF